MGRGEAETYDGDAVAGPEDAGDRLVSGHRVARVKEVRLRRRSRYSGTTGTGTPDPGATGVGAVAYDGPRPPIE